MNKFPVWDITNTPLHSTGQAPQLTQKVMPSADVVYLETGVHRIFDFRWRWSTSTSVLISGYITQQNPAEVL